MYFSYTRIRNYILQSILCRKVIAGGVILREKLLSELEYGEKGIVKKITTREDMRRRFQDIGIVTGSIIECVGKSPFGDPKAFLIKGAVIAVRSEDSCTVIIEKLGRDKEYGK